MKKLLLLTGLCLAILPQAQGQMYFKEGSQICCGDSVLVGNAQALEINPSQLGRAGNKRFSLSLLQVGSHAYSNRLNLSDVLSFAFSDDSLGQELEEQLLNPAASEPFSFTSNFDFNWLSFGFATPSFGGVAIRLKDRVGSYQEVPNSMLGLLLQGQESEAYQNNSVAELAAAANGTKLYYSHVRELSIGYGRSIFRTKLLGLHLGATVKRLWGVGYFNTTIEGGQLTGLSAFSEFYNINYGDLRPEGRNLEEFQRQLLSSSGSGWGYDVGATLEIARRFVVGAALMDIGSISWDKGVVEASADAAAVIEQLEDPAVETLNFSEELEEIYQEFSFTEGSSFEVPLNTQLRLNASWLVGKRFSLNADARIPLNNDELDVLNYGIGTYAAGFNYLIIPGPVNLNFSSSIFYSSQYELRVPLGFSFRTRNGAMFSISATDVLTFVSDSKNPLPGISVTGLSLLF